MYSKEFTELLESAARLQQLVPEAVMVGGSAVILYTNHRLSEDHDHVVTDLVSRYKIVDDVLQNYPGWVKSVRGSKSPATLMGTLDGTKAGLRQLRRRVPLETTVYTTEYGSHINVPTIEECIRIKAFLLITRRYIRDLVDLVALAYSYGLESTVQVFKTLGAYYDNTQEVYDELKDTLLNFRHKGYNKALFDFNDLVYPWKDKDFVRQVSFQLGSGM